MLKSKTILIIAVLMLLTLPAVYMGHALENKSATQIQNSPAATAPQNQPDQAGFNSLSRFNITHQADDKELRITVKGNFKEGVDAFIDEGRLVIRQKNADSGVSEESYALPVAVNENGVKTEIRENQISLSAPVIKKSEENKTALKNRMDRVKRWNALDKDIDSLFKFNEDSFANDDIFGKNFFDDEFERINRQMKNMMKMHENLSRQMNMRGFGGIDPAASGAPQCKVSHKIENGNVIVEIAGTHLDNLEFKVEDNIFKIQNKVSGSNEESSENQISKMNFHSTFAESFSLPAPVESAKMKIDKTKEKITVTLPIAK